MALDEAIDAAVRLRSENDALRARIAAQDALLWQAEAALAGACEAFDGDHDTASIAPCWTALAAIRAAREGA